MQCVQVAGNGFAAVPPKRDASGITARQFATALFKWEYCGECHGDVKDHTFVIGIFGNWFAVCNSEHVAQCKVCG